MKNTFTVVKFGSELVTNERGIDHKALEGYAQGLKKTYGAQGLIVVTSGAVAAGRIRQESKGVDVSEWKDSTLAQLGCTSVMFAWESAFEKCLVSAGGLLVTHNEIEDRSEGLHFVHALEESAERSVVSVINENDALSNTELMELACGGDNDGLAAHIARAVGAEALVLFTKKGGLVNNKGVLIKEVDDSNIIEAEQVLASRGLSNKARGAGRGGFAKKLQAARSAAAAGIQTSIAAVNHDMTGENITRVVVG